MADNFQTNPASGGGQTFAADDMGGVMYPRIKITLGADGAVEGDVCSARPMPISAIERYEFARIKEKKYKDTEEVRYDIPASLISADIYVGVATDGTATASASWVVLRTYFDASGNPSRERIRTGVAWDNRTSGWT